MTSYRKNGLRAFATSPGQAHIEAKDRHVYLDDNPTLKMVVVGTGTIGQEHMRVAFLSGSFLVYGVFDEVENSMDTALANYDRLQNLHGGQNGVQIPQVPKRYQSIEEVCSDQEVDAIFICTPNYSHLEVLKQILPSGKAIFMEKPMATTLADCEQVLELGNAYTAPLQVGLQYRYKAMYSEALTEVFQRQSIGTVKTISLSEHRPPFLDKVKQWNKFNEYSGGTLLEKCCHYFDLLNFFAGSKPEKIFASGGKAVNFADYEYQGRASDIDDHAFVIIDYANGVRANFTLNMFSPNFSEDLIVSGDEGRLKTWESASIHHQHSETKLQIEKAEDGTSRQCDLAYPKIIEQSGHHGATWFEHLDFAERVQNFISTENVETPTPTYTPKPTTQDFKIKPATLEEGYWSIRVALAAQESMVTGNQVVIKS